MSDDTLERATGALRDTTVATSEQLESSLTRLELARRPRASSRRRMYTWAWALASTFVGVGAWANATGRVNWFELVPSAPEAPIPSEPPAALARSAAPAIPTPEPLPEVTPEVTAEPPIAPPPRRAPARRETSASAGSVTPPITAPTPPDPADTLYRAAHTSHFGAADYVTTLDAWDRYLAEAGPGHRFWVEARFNRAIALYRLGRLEAARAALTPFAEGAYGGYRRGDARRLLDAMDEQR